MRLIRRLFTKLLICVGLFTLFFWGRADPYGDTDCIISPPKQKACSHRQHHASRSRRSLWNMRPWFFPDRGHANPKFSAFHLAASVETTDCIIRPEVMNMMVTDFKHTLTHAHFPKWSHFDGCTHSEPHTTPPGTHSGKHPHLTEAELELVLCWVTGCLKSQCKRETNI